MNNLIYLDNSATSFPKPDSVYDFMCNFYKTKGVSPGRTGFDAAIETEEMVAQTRRMLMELFNGDGDPNRLTFSYNASDSLNMLINGLAQKGDHVISTMLEHNSVLRPLYHLEQDGIIEVEYVPFDKITGYIDPEDIKRRIKKNTRMVVMNHCSNVLGTVQPIGEVGKICKEAGVLFIVDGSQSAGAVKVDMQAMGIDAFAFTGHKCLMGPTGIGGSYVMKDVPVRSTRFGGTGVRSAQRSHLTEFPYRLECGTLNLLGVAGLHAGVKWITEQGIENLHRKEMDLWDKMRSEIQKIENVTTYCAVNRDHKNPVLSLNVNGFESGDVGTMLDVDYNIACRTGLQCAPFVHQHLGTDLIHGTVRLSIGPFTLESDVDAAIQAIQEIADFRK
ncbi:MAG TPA: aminotransferase class V-fold PLP-dependent enzyme [Bacteroidales bacterium]|nr:aminotransferase class V-fold PLP-dependent enzyme [Bacteroidales bacterium]HPS71166.1 aminotransferase class V-fold PLP-dependent enzyme [Bacteroidales bacterium]